MNRRQLLVALAAGAVITAEGLWVPGKNLISIPSGKVFSDKICFLESWTALPSGKWLKTLTSEDAVLLSQEWSNCPYAFQHEEGVMTVSQEFWLPRENTWINPVAVTSQQGHS